jgi:RHS repeat-associated protein
VRNRTSPKGGSFTRRVFRYDSLGFLRNACDSTGSQCQNTVNGGTSGDAWSYDSTGNRSQVGTSDGYGNGNRITSFGSVNFTHDSVGAIVCRIIGTCPSGTGTGLKYGWDALGRLRAIRDGFTNALIDSFAYDPQGRRVIKKKGTGGTEYYVYEGSQVILDVDSTGAVLREYAWFPGTVDRLLALRTPMDTFAAVLDPQTGSVRGLARFRTGARVKEYAELPWGDVAADTGLVVRYRFAGREYDQETGLYYMRARYYDPTMGRWISEDPIGVAGGLNLYAYVGMIR